MIGIDEAGRGPVLGPMVIGVVEWSHSINELLENHGLTLTDSKDMSQQDREETATFLKNHVNYRIGSIPAWVIAKNKVSIPQVEARVICSLLKTLDGKQVVSDALGSGNQAHRWIKNHRSERSFTFESGADKKYPSVSAASVLAKVERDRTIEHLTVRWGNIGSGYPSDPKTRNWLESWNSEKTDWPPFVRTNWSTIDKINC